MSVSQFSSTSFFLSKWAQEDKINNSGKSRIELDIVEDPSTREVCNGDNCSLFYDSVNDEYITTGKCTRNTFCTETRIMKDGFFVETGLISQTINCVNYNHQIKNW